MTNKPQLEKQIERNVCDYAHEANLLVYTFAEGCAFKYLTRWRDKGGIADLEKAKHFIELLIELEKKNETPTRKAD